MIVVDASVWVSAAVPQDPYHAASRRSLRLASPNGLAAPGLVLAELAGAVARRTGSPALGRRAVTTLLRIPGLRLVAIDRRVAMKAARLAADLMLKGADATYVAIARQLKVPLATLDGEQQTRGAKAVSIVVPSERGFLRRPPPARAQKKGGSGEPPV